MYTKTTEFIDLLSHGAKAEPTVCRLTEEQNDRIAQAIHETYNNLGLKEGWLSAEDKKGFSELDEFDRNSNIAAAKRMLANLNIIGLGLEVGVASKDAEEDAKQHIEYHLELLSEAEHDGWMDWHLSQGWKYADIKKKDKKSKLHPCLKPFIQLKQVEREKDRESIRHYCDFAREAEMKIVFQKQL